MKQSLDFTLKPNIIICRVFWLLLGVELLIVFLDVFVNHYKWSSIGAIRRMFNITREDSLSNWFSSIQIITVGTVLLMVTFAGKKKIEIPEMRKFYCWLGIAIFFIYMGIDDAIKFHERIGTAFKTIFKHPEGVIEPGIMDKAYSFFPSYSWQMVFGPFFASIGLFILWFLWKELSSKKLKYLLLVALTLYAIAVGLDFVEGLDSSPYKRIAEYFGTKEFRIRHMSKAVEEFFEMFGTTIFLTLFLRHLFNISNSWKITINEER